MDYVEGMNLAEMVRERPLSQNQAAGYVKTIAEAIHYAHQKGTLHRDLKPSNVLVDLAGQPRITDFGLARPLKGESGLTLTGAVMGTPGYMSPEQAKGAAAQLTVASDVYSLGGILYALVTGRAPFQAATTVETVRLVLETEPPPPRTLNPEVSRDLETICLKCLEKDARMRYESARELGVDLERFLRGEPIAARPLSMAGRLWRWRKRNPWPATAAAALVLLLVVVSASAVMFRQFTLRPPQPLRPGKIIPLTTDQGVASRPSISPDGTRVAFGWRDRATTARNETAILVKTIGVENKLRLAIGLSPAWSQDGTRIAFLRLISKNKASVHVIPALGGTEQTIGEVVLRMSTGNAGTGGFLAWTPDGKGLITSDGDPAGLILLSTITGGKSRLTTSPGPGVNDLSPTLSPTGDEVAFVRLQGTTVSDIYRLRLTQDLRPKSEPERLTFFDRNTVSPAWSSDGRAIFFSTNEPERGRRLWRMAARGKPSPEPLDAYGEGVQDVAVGGNRLVYSRRYYNPDIWAIDIQAGQAPRAGPFIASNELEMNPQYSPDGERIAFQSNRSGHVEIWTCGRDGDQCRQLTFLNVELNGFPRWSPDGKQIAFQTRHKGFANICTISADGGPVRKITAPPNEDYRPAWSHDGSTIFFMSARSGEEQIWKVPAAGGQPTQVTRNGGDWPVASQNGKYLYYVKHSEPMSLWRMPVEGGIETLMQPSLGAPSIAVTNNGVYFITRAGQDYTLRFFKHSNRQTTTICGVKGPIAHGLTVSPDGQRILYTQGLVGLSSLVLVENR